MEIMKKNVCILDYGSGNVGSVNNLLHFIGIETLISNKPDDIKGSTHLILPGVGSFGSAMEKMSENLPIKLIEEEVIHNKKPFLGICVGMQVLANFGFEFGQHEGLGWIDGTVDLIKAGNNPLPHIGWNNVDATRESKLMNGLNEINDFYFVNSFCFNAKNKGDIIAETTYHQKFTSVIGKENIFGVQFHPEKSHDIGEKVLLNFINI